MGEEPDVAGARQFLRGASGRVGAIICRRGAGRRADGVEVVGYERLIGDEKKEGEFFKYSDLGHA